MNPNLSFKTKFRLVSKTIIIFSLFFIIFLVLNYFYLERTSFEKRKANLQRNINKILSDIKYDNDKWDISLYIQDTNTPFDKPLYIITKEGFIIERMNPISGFLDTSHFDYVNSFTIPTTITTPTTNKWRVYSYPIKRNNKLEGTILTAAFDPNLQLMPEIDRILIENAEKIDSFLEFNKNKLSVDKLDPKNIHYSIHFSVVDKFNRVLKEDGGLPNFMDRSFIAKELTATQAREIVDEITKESFLVLSQPIFDKNNIPVGTIIYGESLKNIREILHEQRFFSAAIGIFVLIFLSALVTLVFGKEIKLIIQEKTDDFLNEIQQPKFIIPNKISFDKKLSCIFLDNQAIPIEYGSKQYDLCKTLLSSPHKRWENDELLERNSMDDDNNQRVFYDAAIKINHKIFNKIGMKLIVYKDKTYRINPDLLSRISKS